MNRLNRISFFLGLLAACLFCLPQTASAGKAKRPFRPTVDVVFVLDTTGSMGGLIQAAKTKIWSIVNEIVKGKPTPRVRLGLIGYRDKGDQYITTLSDLTEDVDAIYEKLMAFRADGGGDGPEHVNQALSEAVNKMSWTQNRRALKIVFLVGDAPPHMDYQDDVKYMDTCQQAVKKDIIIHTVQCGNYAAATTPFKDIAHRSEGSYMAIAQTGGAVAVATPYDGELAKLSGDLDRTHLSYGSRAEQKASKAKLRKSSALALEAAPEAAAARASFRGKSGTMGSKDLLSDAEEGRVDLDSVDDEALPEPMRKMSTKERKAYLNKTKKERKRIQKQIAELSKKRDAFVKKEMSKKSGAKDSFDAKVVESIRDKAAKKGIEY
ncbi:MAG: VWA domain-containing protein [Deltaproteobacteria bacterium]|nr:VWA domain-containing protein [Deltaproteobacteria bacterium]